MLDKWNQRHREAADQGQVAQVLLDNSHLLPVRGKALDLACGRGASALYLAARGLEVSSWDFSPVAIDRLLSEARRRSLTVSTEVRDLITGPMPGESFDVILVSYFLERSLAARIVEALKPGGLLYYQTFSLLAVHPGGPQNPAYRLADNELLELFKPLRVRSYREESDLGDTRLGVRDIAMLVAQKPG
ncbi:MAG: class I SAM-dependent methyltransferase [Gammaproteobacteria bacterium]|nr:class I SAM-dependent methyltransferase [Gammaproteobacteria bacterium]